MQDLILDLVPLAILGALAPVPVAILITLLMSRRGFGKAVAFTTTATVIYLLAGIVTLTVSFPALDHGRSVLAGSLLAICGLALWWWAIVQFRSGRGRGGRGRGHPGQVGPGRGEPGPTFFDRLDAMSVRAVVLWAVLITVLNVKQFGLYLIGLSQIAGADVGGPRSWLVMLVFLVVFQIAQGAILGACLVAPDRSSRLLARLHAWLLPRLRTASVLLGSVVGTVFLILAAGQLAG